MKWRLAACCVIAVAVVAVKAGVGEREELRADAKAKAKAKADANAEAEARARAEAEAKAPAAREPEEEEEGTVHELAVEGDLPAYVVRPGKQRRVGRAVFLTGSCTHPLTYVNAFRRAAAEHGGLVALQGDTLCRDGKLRRWSPDTVLTSARIDAALQAAGIESASDVTLIGYSQGAERAEWLARRFPGKYTRFVLMAGPIVPSAARFSGAHAVVTLAGYGDVRENMADGAKRLKRASIPATYMELPGIQHGELAPAVDGVVARAFDWLDSNGVAPQPNAARAPDARARARAARGHTHDAHTR